MSEAEVVKDSELAAGAGAGVSSLRCRKRGREEDESKNRLSLLSTPPEVLSTIMLFLEGATLAQASCVSKVGGDSTQSARSRWWRSLCVCIAKLTFMYLRVRSYQCPDRLV